MLEALIVSQRTLPEGFEFHLSHDGEARALCGSAAQPTQIPPYFWAVDSAIEGRWCTRCESLSRKLSAPVEPVEAGYAPCV